LGIGRNSVREAVKSLEALGVLETRHGTGVFVRAFSFDPLLNSLEYGIAFQLRSLNELRELRLYLELGTVDALIRTATSDQVERARAVLLRMHADAREGSYRWADDRVFHEILYESIPNPLFHEVWRIYWTAMDRVLASLPVEDYRDPKPKVAHHEQILQALVARDAESLRTAIAESHSRLAAWLRDAPVDTSRSLRGSATAKAAQLIK
jgi:DNA-binding FadR family transcriptional regulator